MKTIGVIGGSSDVATVEYYKLINAGVKSRLGGHNTAEIVVASMNFGEVDRLVNGNLWEEGVVYLHDKAKRLEAARADFVISVSNTWHRIHKEFMADISIPLLHIVDPTAIAIRSAGHQKVLLLGTKATMSQSFLRDRYADKFQITTVVPSENDQDYINEVIFNELTQSQFKDASRQGFLKVIDKARQEEAEGAILGCTEIGLLVKQSDCPGMPLFDPLVLHAEAAVRVALKEGPAEQIIDEDFVGQAQA